MPRPNAAAHGTALTTVRRILDVITDILILLSLAIAGIGHFLPWAEFQAGSFEHVSVDFQIWHAARSGIALGLAGLLVGGSLAFDPGLRARKFLVVLTFGCLLVAVGFQIAIYTPYPITEVHRSLSISTMHEQEGYLVALVPTIVAAGLCLVRMAWTMPFSAKPAPPTGDPELPDNLSR